jgi:hypothetical protein
VDLRTLWLDEAHDFTPGLVKEENLRRFSGAHGAEFIF